MENLGELLAKFLLNQETVLKPVVKTVNLPNDSEALLSSQSMSGFDQFVL